MVKLLIIKSIMRTKFCVQSDDQMYKLVYSKLTKGWGCQLNIMIRRFFTIQIKIKGRIFLPKHNK